MAWLISEHSCGCPGPFLFNSNELVSTSSSVICREKNNSIKRNFKFLVKLISFDHSKKIDAYSSFLFLENSKLFIPIPLEYNGPHNGQKYVGYNTERSEGCLRVFVPVSPRASLCVC